MRLCAVSREHACTLCSLVHALFVRTCVRLSHVRQQAGERRWWCIVEIQKIIRTHNVRTARIAHTRHLQSCGRPVSGLSVCATQCSTPHASQYRTPVRRGLWGVCMFMAEEAYSQRVSAMNECTTIVAVTRREMADMIATKYVVSERHTNV